MIECERYTTSTLDKLAVIAQLQNNPTAFNNSSHRRGGDLDMRSGSFASQISDLSSSFSESFSVYDAEDSYWERDCSEDMVFGGAELTSSYDISDVEEEEIFEFSDPELEATSEPETGTVADICDVPKRLSAASFNRPKLVKSLSTSADDRYIHLHQYKLMETPIGEGTTSIVKLAINRQDNNRYAMKILSKTKLMKRAMLFKSSPKHEQDPYREIAILRKLNHPNIVKLVDVLDDPEEDELYMVFELMEGGKVLDVPTKSPLTEKQARLYFRDILSGVEYLHLNRIIHRDLKPDNMLLDENGHVKIADFGLSGEFVGMDDQVASPNGTPAFTAPECLDPEKKGFSGQAIDMWSLGISLYTMLFGDVPFKDENVYRLYERVRNDPLSFPDDCDLSSDCKDFISRLLEKNPGKRLAMSEAMNHPWISQKGKDPLPTRRGSLVPVPEDLTTEDLERCIHKVPKVKRFILIRKFSSGVSGLLARRKRRLSANSESDATLPTLSTSPFRRGSATGGRLFKRGKKPDGRRMNGLSPDNMK